MAVLNRVLPFSHEDNMKIPGPTRRSAIKAGYDIRIVGMFYEVVHMASKTIVGRSETSAKDALNEALGTRRTASVRPEGSSPKPNKVSRELRSYITDPEEGSIDPALFEEVANANGLKTGRWSKLNGGLKVMALINTLRGIVVGARRRTPKPIVIGTLVIRPGDDLS